MLHDILEVKAQGEPPFATEEGTDSGAKYSRRSRESYVIKMHTWDVTYYIKIFFH